MKNVILYTSNELLEVRMLEVRRYESYPVPMCSLNAALRLFVLLYTCTLPQIASQKATLYPEAYKPQTATVSDAHPPMQRLTDRLGAGG